jgi:hypothetical protein
MVRLGYTSLSSKEEVTQHQAVNECKPLRHLALVVSSLEPRLPPGSARGPRPVLDMAAWTRLLGCKNEF